MSLLQHALLSLKRKKKDAVSLAVLIFLAVMLLTTGLSIQTTIGDFFAVSNERLHAPHYTTCIPNNKYKDSYLEYLQNDPRVSEAELKETAIMYGASYEVNGGKVFLYADFFPVDETAQIGPFSVLEEAKSIPEDAIYVPYFFKNNGYGLGDAVQFEYNGELYSFTIAGYFETTWYGTSVNSMVMFYLPEDAYQELYGQIGGGKYLTARLHNMAEVDDLRQDFKNDTGLQIQSAGLDITSFDGDIYEMQTIAVMIPSIMTVVMMAFSVVMFAIIFLVIRFRVYSHMEDNMKNIGVMEAIGNTSGQIRVMLMMEYTVIALAGCLPGVAASYGLIHLLGGFLSGYIGARWMMRSYLGIDLFCILLLVGLVLFLTGFYSRKIKKITPVMAFRGGMEAHSFRRNIIPFTKYQLPLQFQMACKGMGANIKQYLMIAVILLGVTAAAALSVMLYSNMSGTDSAVYKAIGMENANVSVRMARHQDLEAFAEEMMANEEVRSTSTYFAESCEIEGRGETIHVSDDFSKLERIFVYEGTFPQHDNEIVISGPIARGYNKSVGDTVRVSRQGVSAEYIICGLTQTMNNLGRVGLMSREGMRRINPAFEITELNIYLKDGYQSVDFIEKLEQNYKVLSPAKKVDITLMTPEERAQYRAEEKITKLLSMYGVDSADYSLSVDGEVVFSGSSLSYKIEQVDNIQLFMETSVSSFVMLVALLAFGVLVATLFIVALILVLVIRYMILKRRQEFGIMKAMGYTSAQIRVQIAFGFLPVSAVGIAAGCTLAACFLNPVMNVLLAPMGASSLDFFAKPSLLLVLFGGLMIYVFLIAFLSSRKVKAITPYELFTE